MTRTLCAERRRELEQTRVRLLGNVTDGTTRNHSHNRRSSEIQGTALTKCLPGMACIIYRSRPAGEAQSNHAFVGGAVSTWAR